MTAYGRSRSGWPTSKASTPTDYGPQMAGYVIASIPLLLLFFLTMREFIRGLTAGAVKM